jgi:hypothetical protein
MRKTTKTTIEIVHEHISAVLVSTPVALLQR